MLPFEPRRTATCTCHKVCYVSPLPAIADYWWLLKQLASRSDAELLGVWYVSKLFNYQPTKFKENRTIFKNEEDDIFCRRQFGL